jgi:hypothetical protein
MRAVPACPSLYQINTRASGWTVSDTKAPQRRLPHPLVLVIVPSPPPD